MLRRTLPLSDLQISPADRRELLARARRAISEAILHERIPDFAAPAGRLAEPGDTFVTLHLAGRLRGCMGRLEARTSLADTVAQCAISSALHDPRFSPVKKDELDGLEIEISVLSELFPITLPEIETGRHGLLVKSGAHRGLLLPQVAPHFNWSAERFLEETCLKAGIAADAWRNPETQVLGFTAEVFSEAKLQPSADPPNPQ